MARHYDLNKLRLSVDDDGFVLNVPGNDRFKVLGEFNEPEIIKVLFLRNDVLRSYTSQKEVIAFEVRGDPDASSPDKEVIEVRFQLAPGVNWFELDHTLFNEKYVVKDSES